MKQYFPLRVSVALPKGKVTVTIQIDLWGLTEGALGEEPHLLEQEIWHKVIDKLKVKPLPGQRQALRRAWRTFHNK